MGSHPLNLAFRFVLELSALAALGLYGWVGFEAPLRWVAAVGLPLAFMVAWGTFAVLEDPSRSGKAPVPIPGPARLGLELALFAGAGVALHFAGHPELALAFAAALVLHYALSWGRIRWLLTR